jgi:hypothetical protein
MDQTRVSEKDPRAEEAERRWSELKSERSWFETMWEEMAQLLSPQRGGFSRDSSTNRQLEKPLSSAPILAASNFSAGLYGNISNPANRWMGFETPFEEVNAWQPAAAWIDQVTRRVLNSFQPSVSPFYSATSTAYRDLAVFGNAAGYDELEQGSKRILDVTLNLSEVCYDIDGHGRVVEVVRKFYLKPHAALEMFGAERCPAKLVEMAEKQSNDKVAFYHHVKKNRAWEKGRIGVKGKAWISRYATEVDHALVRESGYARMPFYAPRWDVESGFVYGTGPGFNAMASARVVQQMDAATIRAAQRAADPTLLAPDREAWALNGMIRPGQVIYNGLNFQGQAMLQPLSNVGQVQLTIAEKQQKVEEIRDCFHYSLMTLAGRTGMTATEVLAIEEERLRLWAPHTGRIQEEYLAPKVERRFEMLWAAGQLPPPPKGLEGVPLQIKYQSAAAMAMRAREGMQVTQFLGNIGALAQLGPDAAARVADRVDVDGFVEVLHDAAASLPAKLLRSREEADQIGQARAQAQQAMQAMQMAEAGAGVAKDLAGAGMMGDMAQGGGA